MGNIRNRVRFRRLPERFISNSSTEMVNDDMTSHPMVNYNIIRVQKTNGCVRKDFSIDQSTSHHD
jgi:hypothetical protein